MTFQVTVTLLFFQLPQLLTVIFTVLLQFTLDPSAAEFSCRRRRKIWSRRNPPKKIRLAENPPEKQNSAAALRPIFGGGAKKRNYGI